jgi:hypothetical protein
MSGPGPEDDDERTYEFIPWRLGPGEEGESCRWRCIDGRWISVRVDKSTKRVVVRDSSGRERTTADYGSALEVARGWRIWPGGR